MAKLRLDLTGDKYGRLTVLKEVERDGRYRRFLCVCECGNEAIVRMGSLRSGDTQSCGCLRDERSSLSNAINLINRKFGMLRVTAKSRQKSKRNRACWICVCECGQSIVVPSDKLLRGSVQSCGCLNQPNIDE